MDNHPSIFEILKRSDIEEKCIEHFANIRWPHGLTCIRCGSPRVMKFKALGKTNKVRHLYECVDCHYQYSVTASRLLKNQRN